MPIVTVTVQKPKTPAFKAMVLNAVQAALVGIGVHANDRFHRVFELDAQDFQFDPTFPDVPTQRTADFVLLEILLGVGRSVKVKKQFITLLVAELQSNGFDPENLMICFQDVPWENWSPAGGRVPHG